MFAVDRRPEAREPPLEDGVLFNFGVTGAAEQGQAVRVRFQHAGRLAAAVQAKIESVRRLHAAGPQGAGAVADQVGFALLQQVLARLSPAAGAPRQPPGEWRRPRYPTSSRRRGCESGVRKTDQTVVILCHKEAVAVKIRLAKYALFQQGQRHRLRQHAGRLGCSTARPKPAIGVQNAR